MRNINKGIKTIMRVKEKKNNVFMILEQKKLNKLNSFQRWGFFPL